MANRMMTRSLLAAVAVTMLPAVAGASWNQSLVFNIQGTNPLVCNLTVGTPNSVDTTFLARGTEQSIASVGVVCNQPTGFTTSYSSANAGKLVSGANQLAYHALVTGDFSFAAKSLTTDATATTASYPGLAFAPGVSGQFKVITCPGCGSSTALTPPGTYTDTVSITLAANP